MTDGYKKSINKLKEEIIKYSTNEKASIINIYIYKKKNVIIKIIKNCV